MNKNTNPDALSTAEVGSNAPQYMQNKLYLVIKESQLTEEENSKIIKEEQASRIYAYFRGYKQTEKILPAFYKSRPVLLLIVGLCIIATALVYATLYMLYEYDKINSVWMVNTAMPSNEPSQEVLDMADKLYGTADQ